MNKSEYDSQIHKDLGDKISVITPEDMDYLRRYYKNNKKHINANMSYDVRYMRLAREFSYWSKDPSTQLGAVAISETDKMVLSQGYNGFPRGILDDYRLYIRSIKYEHIVHAEMNVIYNAYEKGISLKGSTLYVYGLPVCLNCANAIIQVGIKRVVITSIRNDPSWESSFEKTKLKFTEAGISVDFLNIDSLGIST